jgi:ankyrin repeat protein
MYITSHENKAEAMQWLFDHGANEDVRTADNEGTTPMYASCENGHLHGVQFLHANGAAQDVNAPSWNQETPLWKVCKENGLDIVQWLILQGTPLKTTVASWFNQLKYQNRMILYQQGLENRDVDHESYLAFVTAANHGTDETTRDVRCRTRRRLGRPSGVHLIHIRGIQEIIGEFVRGIKETRSLWYHIVQQGPGDESDDEEENEENEEEDD